MKKRTDEAGYWIYRKSIRTRSGRIIYASSYGLRAFKNLDQSILA